LLLMFRDRETDFTARFRTACAVGDMGVAMRLAHDLKSVAGSLGAQAVHQAAAALELACTDGSELADLEAMLSAVTHELDPVIAGLTALR
jgi:HPt (histidine-containing phosphotransfer) domain-containing protein